MRKLTRRQPGRHHQQPPAADLPALFESVRQDDFPFTLQVRDADTDELLWEAHVTGPGAVRVPGFAPRKVRGVVIDKNGRRTREPPPA